MRYAVVMAGGSGTRLWPMSRAGQPKQLIRFIAGQSLLQMAVARLDGLIGRKQVLICAGQRHRQAIAEQLPWLGEDQFLGEPVGRDTLNAVALTAAVIERRDPGAVIAVFTADHIIEPIDLFQEKVAMGYHLAETQPNTLVTFGIRPTHPASSYGYLELGAPAEDGTLPSLEARKVVRFCEKPDPVEAARFMEAGSDRYLWNSGMFVWRAATLLACVRRFKPATWRGLAKIAAAYEGPRRQAVLDEIYGQLERISVDYAVMEPASRDATFKVVAVAMPLTWLDVGSWPAFAQSCAKDAHDNAVTAKHAVLLDTAQTLVASSDPDHLIAAIGCQKMLIIHTPDATLVCRDDCTDRIKALHETVRQQFGQRWL